jgi:hypothetical protein
VAGLACPRRRDADEAQNEAQDEGHSEAQDEAQSEVPVIGLA